MRNTGPDAFVSFSALDARLGAAVCQYLSAAGLKVMQAPPREAGEIPWLAQVARAVARCRKLIILLTDRTPAGWMQAELAFAQRQLDQEVVPVVRVGVDVQLPGSFVPVHLSDDPAAVQGALSALAARVRQPRQPPPIIETTGRPFPGLRPFGLHDGRWFFGRDRAVAEATRHLGWGGVRWLRIEGTQGVGKTSFVRAGVCGAILRGACGGPHQRSVVAFRPGATPMTALQRALASALSKQMDAVTLSAWLDRPDGLTELLVEALPDVGLVLIIDHFDDLASAQVAEGPEITRFDALIGRALADPRAELLLITSGTTSQSRRTLDLLPKLTESVPVSSVYTLGGLTPAEIEQAIVGPLQLSGIRWPEDLLRRLLADATRIAGTPGPLAWMLARLHRERAPSLDVYARIGGLQYAPGRALDARLDVMTGERRDRTITLILASISAGRGQNDSLAALAPSDAEAIAGGGPEGRALLKGLSHGAAGAPDPLLVADPSDEWYRLAHSEMLRIWPRLRGLVATYRAVIERHADIERAASGWAARGRDPAELPTDVRLELHTGADLPPSERERLRAILSTTARAYVGAAESTASARKTAEDAIEADAAQQRADEIAATRSLVAHRERQLKLVGFTAIGGILLLLGFLFLARRDAVDARSQLKDARTTHATATGALATRTATAQDLEKDNATLTAEKARLERALARGKTTARLAAQEAGALLRFARELAAEIDARVGVQARRRLASWQVERLERSLEATPNNDRLRLLLAHLQLRLANTTASAGGYGVVGGQLKRALKTLAVLTRRDRPAPAALVAEAEVHDAAAAFYLKARGVPAYRDRALARDAAKAAVDAWQRVVRLYPNAPRHHAGLSKALAAQGAIEQRDGQDATVTLRAAARAAERLAAAAPGDFDRAFAEAKAFFAWAEALAAADRKAEARAALTQVLDRLRRAEGLAADPQKNPVSATRRRARALLGRLSQ